MSSASSGKDQNMTVVLVLIGIDLFVTVLVCLFVKGAGGE